MIKRRQFLFALSAGAGILGSGYYLSGQGKKKSTKKPNFLLIVSDDQGYGDSSCYKHPPEIETPSIDMLAKEGIRMTRGYASCPVCAPTRAGLMTGRYHQRFGFYDASDSRVGLPLKEITIADLLKKAGYVTGIFGKWHLGLTPAHNPVSRGFDEFYGFLGHGAHDYFKLGIKDTKQPIYRNKKPINDTGYLTHNLTREAVSFIKRHKDRPFFCYLPYNAVHKPMQALKDDIKKYKTSSKDRNIYLAMLKAMDEGVGKVLHTLKETGVDKNTIIIFFSDNGGAKGNASVNKPLRDYKHSVYEGGIRVPFIISWPGHLDKGKTCDEPVISIDAFTTICSAAGVALPDDRIMDGKDIIGFLKGKIKKPLHKALFFAYIHGKKRKKLEKWAIVKGQWKLLSDRKNKIELYDLDNDIAEKKDLARKKPELTNALKSEFQEWRDQMAPQLKRSKRKR